MVPERKEKEIPPLEHLWNLTVYSCCLPAVNYSSFLAGAGSSTRTIGIPPDEPDVDGDAF